MLVFVMIDSFINFKNLILFDSYDMINFFILFVQKKTERNNDMIQNCIEKKCLKEVFRNYGLERFVCMDREMDGFFVFLFCFCSFC